VHNWFWWRYLKERAHLEDLGMDRRKILKYLRSGRRRRRGLD
jgi:hypothetical protein